MDTAARIGRARKRLENGRAELAAMAGYSSCQSCAFRSATQSDRLEPESIDTFRPDWICLHPAAATLSVNIAHGIATEENAPFVTDARTEAGICGPEGALFSRKVMSTGARITIIALAAIAVANALLFLA
jgi:hypothetical protein